MRFLNANPEQPTKTFDTYVGMAAKNALLGPSNANRLIAFGEELLCTTTLEELILIANGSRPPSVPFSGSPNDVADTIAPLVRTVDDFIVDEEVRYHTAEQAGSWCVGNVDLGKIIPIGPTKGEVCGTDSLTDDEDFPEDGLPRRGLVIINEFGVNGVYFSPNWPALISEKLNSMVHNRVRGTHQDQWRIYGRTMIGLSYFDEQATEPDFRTAVRVMLRHWDTPPKKIIPIKTK